ncbi:uncharacterized protein METZ01_LOCUS209685, partial [marine metagenome]
VATYISEILIKSCLLFDTRIETCEEVTSALTLPALGNRCLAGLRYRTHGNLFSCLPLDLTRADRTIPPTEVEIHSRGSYLHLNILSTPTYNHSGPQAL